jgi:type II secretory pathway pseudopilin PulG
MVTSTTRSFRRHLNQPAAFTRLEQAVSLACAALLCALALPTLSTSQSRSQVVQCLNNLRQMGRAVQMWGMEYTQEPPWQTSNSGGGGGFPRPGSAWVEMLPLSNHLASPRILACPSDSAVLASNFSQFASVAFRSAALSYFLNLHATFEYPDGALFGDRNVSAVLGGNCYLQISPVYAVMASDLNTAWTNAVHGAQGNIVLVDGSAAVTDSEGLRGAFGRTDNLPTQHILPAR